jgi:hypothetical protein
MPAHLFTVYIFFGIYYFPCCALALEKLFTEAVEWVSYLKSHIFIMQYVAHVTAHVTTNNHPLICDVPATCFGHYVDRLQGGHLQRKAFK